MRRIIREFIRMELHNYPSYKITIDTFQKDGLLSYRQHLWMAMIVQGIDSAIASFPPEMQRYIELKYFRKNYHTNYGLALKLNIAESTGCVWDRKIMDRIARHIGIIDSTDPKE